jgi:hypothetical protein
MLGSTLALHVFSMSVSGRVKPSHGRKRKEEKKETSFIIPFYQIFFPLLPSSTPLATLATPSSTPFVRPCRPSPTALVPVVLLMVWPRPRPAVPTRPPAVRERPPTAAPSWEEDVRRKEKRRGPSVSSLSCGDNSRKYNTSETAVYSDEEW